MLISGHFKAYEASFRAKIMDQILNLEPNQKHPLNMKAVSNHQMPGLPELRVNGQEHHP